MILLPLFILHRSKHTKGLKEHLFNVTIHNWWIFWVKSLFQAMKQLTKQKLNGENWRKKKKNVGYLSTFTCMLRRNTGQQHTTTENGQVNYIFIFSPTCFVAWKRGLAWKVAHCVVILNKLLFFFSFLPFICLDLLERWQSSLFQIFLTILHRVSTVFQTCKFWDLPGTKMMLLEFVRCLNLLVGLCRTKILSAYNDYRYDYCLFM